MGELITLAVETIKVSILPLFDFLYIGIVLSGATLMLNLFPSFGKTKIGKFRSVFLFASVISLGYAYMFKDLEGFEYMLGRNLFNYFVAILIYHAVIKTIVRLWEKFTERIG